MLSAMEGRRRERLADAARLGDEVNTWLFSGVLFHPGGAIAAWRNHATGTLAYEYPEATGYFLTTAVFTKEADHPLAHAAADYVASRVERGIQYSRPLDSQTIYNFDAAIMAVGLLNIGTALDCERYLAAGIRLAERLRDQVLQHGYLPPIDPRSRPPRRAITWSTVGRLHLLKAVQALCLGSELGIVAAGEAAAALAGDGLRRCALDSHDLRSATGGSNLHAACYMLEGLWLWHQVSGTADSQRLLYSLFDEVLRFQLPTGGFPGEVGTSPQPEQSDVGAQIVRLASVLGRKEQVEGALARLCASTLPTGHGRAVPYGPDAFDLHEASWASMFAVQAIALATRDEPLDWRHLI